MATGIEMLMATFLRNLPEPIRLQIEAVGQISVSVKQQMDRIEAAQALQNAKLDLIMAHRGIDTADANSTGDISGSKQAISKTN